MGKLALFLAVVVLAGCQTTPICSPQIIEVPVKVQPPAPPTFQKPDLPTSRLPANASAEQIVKANAATIEVLKREIQLRDNALNAYR